jgi:hypothetical protein
VITIVFLNYIDLLKYEFLELHQGELVIVLKIELGLKLGCDFLSRITDVLEVWVCEGLCIF